MYGYSMIALYEFYFRKESTSTLFNFFTISVYCLGSYFDVEKGKIISCLRALINIWGLFRMIVASPKILFDNIDKINL